MKDYLISLINQAIQELQDQKFLPEQLTLDIQLSRPKNSSHGDFSTNIAMILSSASQMNSKEIAKQLVEHLPKSPDIKKVEIAGPGFINFFISQESELFFIEKTLMEGDDYGRSTVGNHQRIHIEFVSANPTGPLHVGHGRGAAYGACVSNLLDFVGYHVHREYYVNNAGRQMRILGVSIWLRYLQLYEIAVELPSNAYQGDYVVDIARLLRDNYHDRFVRELTKIQSCLPVTNMVLDKEHYIDQVIEAAIALLGDSDFEIIRQLGIDEVLRDIKEDLEEFGVRYNDWFFESQLQEKGWLDAGITLLKKHGFTYEQEGALWFRAVALGDEKDRVLVRKNGQTTYFASDVAYHTYKYNQGYDRIIDVFGADHHGYIARIKAFLKGLGKDITKLDVLLVQFAILYRGKEKVSMSTRTGEFVTLRELRDEVGNDAARFFYIMRKPDQHLDFDLELAKSSSHENPVYYIQYAHARICSIWRQLTERQLQWDQVKGLSHLNLLISNEEKALITAIASFPEIVLTAALQYAPHKLAHYLQTCAHAFHTVYNAHKFLIEDDMHLCNARLCLIRAAQHVLYNGLTLLGVSAPQSM